MRSYIAVLLCLLFAAGPALADETIDQLTPGSALTGSEKYPMFQGSNPAVSGTPRGMATYLPTQFNTIDATQSSGADMCAKISAAAASLHTASPGGGTIDARGFTGAQACAGSMFAAWYGATPSIANGAYFPVVILQGNAVLSTTYPQIAPPWVQIVRSLPAAGPAWTSNIIFPLQTIVSPAWYASASGSGSTCTLALPCTIAGAQAKAEASSTKTIYLRSGTYTLASVGAGSCGGTTGVLLLNGSGGGGAGNDNGITLSYYPPDGPNTAILDAGSVSTSTGLLSGICVQGANNVTINGIQVQNGRDEQIRINGYTGQTTDSATVVNSILHDNHETGYGTWMLDCDNVCTNTHLINNYLYNCEGMCIGAGSVTSPGSLTGLTIANNYVANSCLVPSDCGGIYIQDLVLPAGAYEIVANNYVNTANAGLGGRGVYLDDGTSNTYSFGNITVGVLFNCYNIHGGQNNVFVGNICDLTKAGANTYQFNYQTSGTKNTSMGGNVFNNNIVVAASSSGGGGYNGSGTPGSPLSIANNTYYNFVGSAIPTVQVTSGIGSDASPYYFNPVFIDGVYSLNPNAGPFLPPTNFPPIPGNWGPPGFVLPAPLTLPSHGYKGKQVNLSCPSVASQTATFTNGSANIGLATTALSVGCPLSFTTTGGLPTNFATATNYYVAASNGLSIQVAAAPGGSAISAGSAGTGVQSALATGALLTTATPKNVAGVFLNAGKWSCSGNVAVTPASTMTILSSGLSATSATIDATNGSYNASAAAFTTAVVEAQGLGAGQFILAASSEIYLVTSPTFASTATGLGNVNCTQTQ